jgi:hypothetical protein
MDIYLNKEHHVQGSNLAFQWAQKIDHAEGCLKKETLIMIQLSYLTISFMGLAIN